MTPIEMRTEATRLWKLPNPQNGERGAAEQLLLHATLIDCGLDGPQGLLVGRTTNWDAKGSAVDRLQDVEWNYDPAASCHRRRAFVWLRCSPEERLFILVAYEDGGWWLEEKLDIIARGLVKADLTKTPRDQWPLRGPLAMAQICALRALLAAVPLRHAATTMP